MFNPTVVGVGGAWGGRWGSEELIKKCSSHVMILCQRYDRNSVGVVKG